MRHALAMGFLIALSGAGTIAAGAQVSGSPVFNGAAAAVTAEKVCPPGTVSDEFTGALIELVAIEEGTSLEVAADSVGFAAAYRVVQMEAHGDRDGFCRTMRAVHEASR